MLYLSPLIFSDIDNLREYNYEILEWKLGKFFGDNEYYLVSKNTRNNDDNDYLFAILKQYNYHSSLAHAQSANGKWKFINKFKEIKTKNDIDITILSLLQDNNKIPWQGGVRYENEIYIARYYDDLLEFKNGKRFRNRNNSTLGFIYSWSFIDTDTYESVITVKKRFGFKSIASLKIDDQSFDRPDLTLLMILGWQIILIEKEIASHGP
jgi:hypothetical protein